MAVATAGERGAQQEAAAAAGSRAAGRPADAEHGRGSRGARSPCASAAPVRPRAPVRQRGAAPPGRSASPRTRLRAGRCVPTLPRRPSPSPNPGQQPRVIGAHGSPRAKLGDDLGRGLDRVDRARRLAGVERHRLDRAGRLARRRLRRRSAAPGSPRPRAAPRRPARRSSASAASIELRSTRCGPGTGMPTLNALLTTASVGAGVDHRLRPTLDAPRTPRRR